MLRLSSRMVRGLLNYKILPDQLGQICPVIWNDLTIQLYHQEKFCLAVWYTCTRPPETSYTRASVWEDLPSYENCGSLED